VKNGDVIDVKLVCPRCEVYWGDATVQFDAPVTPGCFRVRAEYAGSKHIHADKPLSCPACGHVYSVMDRDQGILSAMYHQKVDEVNKKGYRAFGTATADGTERDLPSR
jgi:rubredoxin